MQSYHVQPARWIPTGPLKQLPKRVESRAVTVCIAAQFRLTPPYVEQPTPAFVLCSDGRLSQGAWGSDDAAIKTRTLGYNFMALMAGHWPTVVDMCAEVERDMKAASAPIGKSELIDAVTGSLARFSSSNLCSKNTLCEAIITGFFGQEPVILRAAIKNRRASLALCFGRDEIGEGAFAARLLLHHRAYDPLNVDLPVACYLVYEAKRFSETVDSVGPLTWLKVHIPITPEPGRESNTFCCMDINQAGLQQRRMASEIFLAIRC
jgi:hypothetical protein